MRIQENNLKAENEVLKRLLKDGFVLINYDSIDCDGCSTSKVLKFYDLESIYESINSDDDYADGPFSYSVPLKHKDGSIDLNDDFTGGQWSN